VTDPLNMEQASLHAVRDSYSLLYVSKLSFIFTDVLVLTAWAIALFIWLVLFTLLNFCFKNCLQFHNGCL